MSYVELQEALAEMGLHNRCTLQQIKARHRALVKAFHPDVNKSDNPERIKRVIRAYRVIMEYISAYRFSFSEEEFNIQNPDAFLWQQFSDDPIWGGGKK